MVGRASVRKKESAVTRSTRARLARTRASAIAGRAGRGKIFLGAEAARKRAVLTQALKKQQAKVTRKAAETKARQQTIKLAAQTRTRQIRQQKVEKERIIKIPEARKKLDKFAEDRGVIFLKKQELEKRGITKTEERELTAREKQAQKQIREAEKILGIKDSGAGFILDPKVTTLTGEETIQSAIKRRLSKLSELEKKRKTTKSKERIGTLRSEINTIKSATRKGEAFGLGASSAVISNVVGITKIPKAVGNIVKEVKKDPRNIVKLGKKIPDVLRREGEEFAELYRVSPTEAIGRIGGELIFFAGTGKALKVVGKIGKIPARAIKTALRGKKGTRIKIIGTQGIKGNKIITKIIFTKGKRQLGGAIGISVIKKGKVLTQAIGKVGKVGRITKKFKTKGVFIGREVSISKSQRFQLISELRSIGKVRKLTRVEKLLSKRLRGKKKTIKLTGDLEGLLQIGVGRIVQAPGKKLLRTTIKFPTGQLKKIKAKGLTSKKFFSFSAVFTKKDLSLIVGKTLSKKRDVIEFIGLIKGTSGRTFKSFSVGKQKLFRRALTDVVGVATATTVRSRTIIPKLSSKAKSLVVRSTGITISKTRVIPKPPKRIFLKQKQLGVKTKQAIIQQTKVKVAQKKLTKQRGAIATKQKQLLKQKTTQATRQKQKQLTKQKQQTKQKQKQLTRQKQRLIQRQKQLTRQKQKLITKFGDGVIGRPTIIPKGGFPVGLLKKKKRKKKKLLIPVGKGFSAEIKRRGKWVKIGTFKKRTQARSRAIKRAKNTLAASIRIKKGGKILKLKTTKEFRRSKSDSRVLVQKKIKVRGVGSRLGTKAEIQAIKKARRRSRPRRAKQVKARRVKKQMARFRSPVIRRFTKRNPIKRFKSSQSRTLIKRAPKGKKPTRFRFKGNRRLGFRNNKVVEIVRFNQRKNPQRQKVMRKPPKRVATPQQLKNLAKGRKILMAKRSKR